MKLTTIKSEDYHLNASTEEVRRILENALNGHQITREEALHLMQAKEPKDLFALFSAANEIKKQHFGNRVFLYGFVYFSTYCRNQCTFCFYRKPNTKPVRYRKEAEEILKVSRLLKDSGVHLIDLTMGEDPLIHEEHRYDLLLNLARTVKEDLDIPVMVSPGILPQHVLEELGKGNVDWYALYQETYNRALFSSLRLNQDYDARMKAKVSAKKTGMLIEEGILVGVGESWEDVVDSVFEMAILGAHQVRAMGFIPQKGTPMEKQVSPPIVDEMKIISLMRLLHQDRLLPASYDIDGVKGLELRLLAGANVVTSIIPPGFNLLGVAQSYLDVEDNLRTVQGVKPYLERIGLTVATMDEYRRWVEKERELLKGRG